MTTVLNQGSDSPPHILIVEDSATQALLYTLLLEDAGFSTDRRGTLREAVDAVKSGRFTLAVVDVNLPDGTGFEFCEAVRAMPEARGLRLLLNTADGDPAHVLRGLAAGADGFVEKQFGGARLLGRVRELLALRVSAGAEEEPPLDVDFRGEEFSIRTDRARLLGLLVSVFDDRVRAGEKIRTEQARTSATLASVLETVPCGVLVTDPRGRPVAINLRGRELFGLGPDFSPSQIPRVCSFARGPGAPIGWHEAPPALTSADGHGRRASELMLIRKDGSSIELLVSTGAVFDAHGQLTRTVTTLQPITDIKDGERVIARSRGFLQSTLDALAERVAVLAPGGRIVATNSTWRRLTPGLFSPAGPADVGGDLLALLGALAADGAPTWRELLAVLRLVMAGRKERAEVEVEVQKASGGEWLLARVSRFEVDGEERVLLALEDISRRKHAERASRESAEGYRALLDAVPAPLALVRWPTILFANRAARELFPGGPQGAPAGVDVRRLLPPERLAAAQAHYRMALSSNAPVALAALEWTAPDGEQHLTDVVSAAVQLGDGPATLALAREHSPKGLPAEDLAHADRMASLGTLAAGVAHEINNPLTYVLASLAEMQELIEGLDDGARTRQVLLERCAETRDGAERVKQIVRGLVTFGRGDGADDAVSLSLNDCLTAATRLAGPEVRYRARLIVDLPTDALVVADANQITQVFLNLLVNAAHALEDDNVAGNRISLRSTVRGGTVAVEVEDNGCGIPAEDIERVLEPFYTTKPIGQGTGLGLSIVSNMVERFGGQLELRSRLGLGTTVRVLLPCSPALPRPAARQEPAALREGADDARILLVEDDPSVARALRRMLRRRGAVSLASSGREAINQLEAGAAFDVIVSDLLMDDVDGMGLFAWLEEHRPDLAARVILLTGGAFTDRARTFVATFPNAVLSKPVSIDEILAAVDQSLGAARPSTRLEMT